MLNFDYKNARMFTYILTKKVSFQSINNFFCGLIFFDQIANELSFLLANSASCRQCRRKVGVSSSSFVLRQNLASCSISSLRRTFSYDSSRETAMIIHCPSIDSSLLVIFMFLLLTKIDETFFLLQFFASYFFALKVVSFW